MRAITARRARGGRAASEVLHNDETEERNCILDVDILRIELGDVVLLRGQLPTENVPLCCEGSYPSYR